MKDEHKLPYNIQFFADGEGTSDQATGTDGGEQSNTDTGDQGQENKDTGKTFTQAELSAVAVTEKKQGKNVILKLFGCEDEKTAKEQAVAFKKWQEDQKTAEQKQHDSEKDKVAAEARAVAAENKLTCISAGVNLDSLEDALAIAAPKVTGEKDLKAVLDEMREQKKYEGFFAASGSSEGDDDEDDDEDDDGEEGTGSAPGHNKKSDATQSSLGKRLAESQRGAIKKSTYFSK